MSKLPSVKQLFTVTTHLKEPSTQHFAISYNSLPLFLFFGRNSLPLISVSLKPMASVRFRTLLLVSAALRVILILYGEWQDTHMEVRYTDIDYMVFSDAASLMAAGKSPFERSTYRYSPLLAFLLIPNSFLHRSWGKFLFSAAGTLIFASF